MLDVTPMGVEMKRGVGEGTATEGRERFGGEGSPFIHRSPPFLTWVLPPQFVSLTVTRRNRSVSADPAPLGDDVVQPSVGDSVQYFCPSTMSSGTFTAPHMFVAATPAQVFPVSLQRLLQKAG